MLIDALNSQRQLIELICLFSIFIKLRKSGGLFKRSTNRIILANANRTVYLRYKFTFKDLIIENIQT